MKVEPEIRAERLLGTTDVCQQTGKPYNAVWQFFISGKVPTTVVNGRRKIFERYMPAVRTHFGLPEPQSTGPDLSAAA